LDKEFRERQIHVVKLEGALKAKEISSAEVQKSFDDMNKRYEKEAKKAEQEKLELSSQFKHDVYQLEIQHKEESEKMVDLYEEKLQKKENDIRKYNKMGITLKELTLIERIL